MSHCHVDVELLARLLSGPWDDRFALASRLLESAGSVWDLSRWGTQRWRAEGLSDAAIARVRAAFELAARGAWPQAEAKRLLGPEDSFAFLAPHFTGTLRERFVSVALDVKSRPLAVSVVSEGSTDSCPVDPREVFRIAVGEGASYVLIAHNHPSGDPAPSSEDLVLTERLIAAGETLALPVLDHIIVGKPRADSGPGGFVSLVQAGLWPIRSRARQAPGKR